MTSDIIVRVLVVRVTRPTCLGDPPTDWSEYDLGIDAAENPIDAEFTRSNTILANSHANFRIEFAAGLDRSDNCDHMSGQTALSRVAAGTAPFADVPSKRNEFEADLVSVWYAPSNNLCGVANSNDTPNSTTYNKAFSVANVGRRNCKFTFIHELAHNFGARHDRYALGGETNPNQANFGYVNLTEKKYTVMAYEKLCVENESFCERVPFFSTPEVTSEGATIGIAPPNPEAAFNVRKLNAGSGAVAGYR